MKLPFESWLEQQNIENEALELFKEGILCYKNSAYRAALLFSFLGFQTILKYRVLESQQPAILTEGHWEAIQKDLLDDDEWDTRLIQLVRANHDKNIFYVSEDLKSQYEYWKYRRNDCAHAKGNKISEAHVEAYWLFIQSNFYKFVVLGGLEHIFQLIIKHHDLRYTSADEDPQIILDKIESAVKPEDLHLLLNRLVEHVESDPLGIPINDSFVAKFFYLQENYVRECVKFFVNHDMKWIIGLLRYDSNIVTFFNQHGAFIRNLWYDHLITEQDYIIYSSLLRNNMVPDNQLEEAHEKMINRLPTDIFRNRAFTEPAALVFEQKGFFSKLTELAFGTDLNLDKWKWSARNRYAIIFYLERYGFTEHIATRISRVLNGSYPPFDFKFKFDEFLENNEERRLEYERYTNEQLEE
ncbi:hypothetical protein [Aureibacillus halotolerans]|uniref:Uncharacterized protein n=1 Tax=Aureibacillus halotolerans TaxID=1508390 RepID=A0A4R6TTI3_9BACI|nr:hypothetical protein [Aureibacillus halotolerans]TDQ35273.1 hypothetical protein EV213_12260 [Aureibacillus halotolerans]